MSVLVNAKSRPLYPRARAYCKGGWVGSRANLGECRKSPPPGFDARTHHPAAIRYTD